MSVYSVGLLVSLLVYLAVGNYAGRKVRHLEDYFVAGRQAPTLLIVGTLVASLMSTNAFMGETGLSYAGYPAVTIMMTAINCIGYVAGGLFFGRFLRRSRALTLAEYFGLRFFSRRVQAVAGVTIVLGCTTYLVMVTQGTATVVEKVTGLPFGLTLLASWAGYTLFTLYSGSRGVVLTDTIMFLLFAFVAFLGVAFIVGEAGGWFRAIQELATYRGKPGILSWHGMSGPGANWQTALDALTYAVILGLGWGIVVAVGPWQASRYLIARSEHTVIRSATITAGVVMVLYVVLMISGAAINLINPDIEPAQENMIWAAMNVMPTLVGVLLMAGIMAAGLSSASTFLSLSGFSISNDILPPGERNDRERLSFSRKSMFAVSAAALLLAYLVPQGKLYWITYFAGTLFASSWGPVAFMSVWSSRITEAGAFWGIIAGLLGNLGVNLLRLLDWDLPAVLDPILVGVALSYLVVELTSRAGQVSAREHDWRAGLHRTPGEEINAASYRRTVFWSWALVACGVLLAGLMLVFYAIPYRNATGGSTLGEFLMSLGVGLALAVTGLLALWGTRAYYRPGTDAGNPAAAARDHVL